MPLSLSRAIVRKKMEGLLSKQFAERYLSQHAKIFKCNKPDQLRLQNIQIFDRYQDKKTFAFIAAYALRCGVRSFRIAGRAHSRHIRRHEAIVHTQIFSSLPASRARTLMPIPYFYDKTLGGFFVSWLKGEPLEHTLKKRTYMTQGLAEKIVALILRLQCIAPRSIKNLEQQPRFSTLEHNLAAIQQRRTSHALVLKQYWRTWKKSWVRLKKDAVLAHGDFHAAHIISHNDNLALIDFERAHAGPRLWDLASFLAHLQSTLLFHLSQKQVTKMQHVLLGAWEKRAGSLDASAHDMLRYFMRYFELLAATHYLVWGNKKDRRVQQQLKRILSSLSQTQHSL